MTSAFSQVKKGTVTTSEVADQLIAILGRTVEKHRKGVLLDATFNSLVNTTDEFIRREHQYRPEMGPKRLAFQALSVGSVLVSPKIGIVEAEQEPYFILESPLLGEKVLVRLSDGVQVLNAHVQRMLPLSEERFAAENKGEQKSELMLEFVAPRLSVYLKPTKPHRVDRDRLVAAATATKSFVNSVCTGFRLTGKLSRGSPPVDESGKPVTPVEEPKKKKGKKAAVVTPEITSITWDFKQTGGTTIDGLGNRSMCDIFETVAAWVRESMHEVVKFQLLWIRSVTAEGFLASLPEVEEYPAKFHVGRCTLTSETELKVANDRIIGDFTKVNESGTLSCFNFEFVSRARNVALINDARIAGEPIAASLASGGGDFALVGLRGFAAGLTCRKGHVAVVSLIGRLPQASASSLGWKRCDRCSAETASLVYVCQVCDERGIVCGICAIAGLGFCPQRHALVVGSAKDAAFVLCEGCNDRGRAVSLQCPVGNHFHKELCAQCTAVHFFPAMARSMEPSPFEHCLVISARVRVKGCNEAETRAFAESKMREVLQDSKITMSPIYTTSEHSEFRFTLERSTSSDSVSPYKRVVDLMLHCEETGVAEVDIVETDCVPVQNPDDASDNSSLDFWFQRLAMTN